MKYITHRKELLRTAAGQCILPQEEGRDSQSPSRIGEAVAPGSEAVSQRTSALSYSQAAARMRYHFNCHVPTCNYVAGTVQFTSVFP